MEEGVQKWQEKLKAQSLKLKA